MFKKGFTLAEILITLGIVGVVAALTAPALVQNAGSAQIGPKLAKAVSTFETANENLLTDLNVTSVYKIGTEDGQSQIRTYCEKLSNYMKISFFEEGAKKYAIGGSEASVTNYDGSRVNNLAVGVALNQDGSCKYLSKDGYLYSISFFPGISDETAEADVPASRKLVGMVAIDVNGVTKPNRLGKDVFLCVLYADGSLRPFGSTNCFEVNTKTAKDTMSSTSKDYYWKDGKTDECNETTVTSGTSCAGSIFENNLKVIY